jgi:Domain of unknown function (DUF1330)
MPAYVVFMREKTLDRSELEAYWSRASATMEGHPIKVLAAYGRHVTLEGLLAARECPGHDQAPVRVPRAANSG